MKKNAICIIVCGVLSVAFIVCGVLAMFARNDKQKTSNEALQQLQEEESKITDEGLTEEAASLDQKNKDLEEKIAAAEDECSVLDEQVEALQQEYETLQQDETNIYYMTILESLTEGMEKVEEYISGSE